MQSIYTQDDLDAAVELMDAEIREDLHMDLAPCSPDVFLRAYIVRHLAKYGEKFSWA